MTTTEKSSKSASPILSQRTPDQHVPAQHQDRDARTHHIEELLSTAIPPEDEALRAELVEVNMPVAATIANRYAGRGVPRDDLRQVAYLGLTKAAQRYDVTSGHAFLSFCVPTIRGEVRRYFRDQGWMVRPPRGLQELQARVNAARDDLASSLGHLPRDEELAEELDEDVDRVREALNGQGSFSPASLDRPVGDAPDASPLGDQLPDGRDQAEDAEARLTLAPVVRRLGRRDRKILALRFYEGLTQREIAEHIGVTQMQVSRLLSRIFRDLRSEIGPLEERQQ